MCLTGTGASFALAQEGAGASPPAGGIGRIISIGELRFSVDEIEDGALADTIMKYCAGDMTKLSQLPIGVAFDPDKLVAIGINNLGTIFSGILTFPLPDGQSTPGNLAGSGFLVEAAMSGLESSARSQGEYVWRYDNQSTPVAFTASA